MMGGNKGRNSERLVYRDDPDALSLHTNPEDYGSEEIRDVPASSSDADGQLPSYERSEAIESASRQNAVRADTVAGLEDQYAVIELQASGRSTSQFFNKKSTNKEVSARMDERLSEPGELLRYISDYLQLTPPRPIVWVEGFHWINKQEGNNKKSRERVTDFEIMLSLQSYLGSASNLGFDSSSEWRRPRVAAPTDKVLRGSWRAQRAPGVQSDLEVGSEDAAGPKELRDWCEAFAADRSWLKIFRVSKEITGLDQQFIKQAVERAVRSTHYRGHLDVRIITEDRAVDIYSQHWINRIRTSWMRWIFYLTFLWIFTWPVVFFMTRRWRVFTVEWPFSVPWPEQGVEARRFATISEHDWFKKHEQLLKDLVLDRFRGNATYMDPTQRYNNNSNNNNRRGPIGRPNTGNTNIDSAVSLIQAGVSGFGALRNQMNGRGREDWGYDD